MVKKLTKQDLKYFQSLNIDTNSKYFRSHFKKNLLNEIDEDFISEVQSYYTEYYGEQIDPITHIAFANLLNNKEIRIIPQHFYRRKFLNVFNDNAMNDMYRDKGLYDILINTEQKAKNILKFTRGQFITDSNLFINEKEAYNILLSNQEEYIVKPSDTNNGKGITKLKVSNDKLFIGEEEVDFQILQEKLGYNYLIQEVIKQHEVLAKPHPESVNTLRMATLRWNGVIHNLYTFARFGHSGQIKDNAGSGGLIVGVLDDGSFMDYGAVASKIVDEHPSTNVKINDFGRIPNMDEINKFVCDLHENILLQNYVAWDIAIDEMGKPIFIENNFYGSSWLNQIALNQPMFGDITDEILQHIGKNESLMIVKNIKSISARRGQTISTLRREQKADKKHMDNLKNQLKNEKSEVNKLTEEVNKLKEELNRMRNSRSWRYTSFLRKK